MDMGSLVEDKKDRLREKVGILEIVTLFIFISLFP